MAHQETTEGGDDWSPRNDSHWSIQKEVTASGKPVVQASKETSRYVKMGTADELRQVFSQETALEIQGVILHEYSSCHKIKNDQYEVDVHWEMSDLLGRGGSGEVRRCRDLTSHESFCVKITPTYAEKDEVINWSRLNHPNICQLHGAIKVYVGQKFRGVYLFMENGGENFHTILNNIKKSVIPGCTEHRMELEQALWYFYQLLSALCHLQKHRIVHHDIKSKNVITDLIFINEETKILKLIDFGESKVEASNLPDEERSMIDVINATWFFREMLTGHKNHEPTHTKSSGTGGPEEPYEAHFIPKSLNLPEEVKQLFQYGWQKKRCTAEELLSMVSKIREDLAKRVIEYSGPVITEIMDSQQDIRLHSPLLG